MHEGGCVKEFFFVNLQVGISQLHDRVTPSQTVYWVLSKWTPSNGYFSILYKMLEKHLWNSFLLYLVVEILQLVHKIAVSEVLFKRSVLKNVSKFTNTRSSHLEGGFLSKEKMFLKILQNLQQSIFSGVTFSAKMQAGDLKPSEAATGDVLKNFANFTGNNLCWSFFLTKLHIWCLQLCQRRFQHRCFPVNLQIFWWTSVNVYL